MSRREEAKTNVETACPVPADFLPLGDVTSAAVQIVVVDDKAAFRLPGSSQLFTGGLAWCPPKDSGMELTVIFQLPGEVAQLLTMAAPELTFDPVTSLEQQQGNTLPVRGEYHFLIQRKDGRRHDPKIIVTPM